VAKAYFDPESSRYTEQRRSTSAKHRLDFHIVLRTKYRRGVLDGAVADKLLELIREACAKYRFLLLGAAVRPEHVHLLLALPPDVSVSDAVRAIKGVTATQIRRVHGIEHLWADGYYSESIGWKNPAQIKAYLERQEAHHAAAERKRPLRKT
jgi:putative transposase